MCRINWRYNILSREIIKDQFSQVELEIFYTINLNIYKFLYMVMILDKFMTECLNIFLLNPAHRRLHPIL